MGNAWRGKRWRCRGNSLRRRYFARLPGRMGFSYSGLLLESADVGDHVINGRAGDGGDGPILPLPAVIIAFMSGHWWLALRMNSSLHAGKHFGDSGTGRAIGSMATLA